MEKIVREALQERLRLGVEQLDNYTDRMNEMMIDEQSKFEAFLDNQTAQMPEYKRNDSVELQAEEAWNLLETFPEMLWRSNFVIIYTFLECELLGICKMIKRENDDPTPVVQGRNKGIIAAKNYLVEQQVEFPWTEKSWEAIQDYNRIRNKITHTDGRITTDQHSTAIRGYIQQRRAKTPPLDTLTLKGSRLVVTADYCKEATTSILSFFDKLIPLLS